MNQNLTFGAEFLETVQVVEYGCLCGDTVFHDASESGYDVIENDPILRQLMGH